MKDVGFRLRSEAIFMCKGKRIRGGEIFLERSMVSFGSAAEEMGKERNTTILRRIGPESRKADEEKRSLKFLVDDFGG
jgi:hypothetical protein